jgi:hypothetical protein
LLLTILGVLIALAFRSWKLQNVKSKTYRLLLALLQYIAVVILLLILWNPSYLGQKETLAKNSVLVLFDTSKSMSLIEDGDMTRLDKSLEVFSKKFQPSKPQRPDYKIFGFDRKAYHSGSASLLRRWGSQTNMQSVLELLGKYDTATMPTYEKKMGQSNPMGQENPDKTEPSPESRVVGAVVFTDGQAEDKNVRRYTPLANKDFQVILIGVGSKISQKDVAIKSVSTPARVTIDTAYNVEVVVAGRNLQNESVVVELLKDGHVIASRQLFTDTLSQGERRRLSLLLAAGSAKVNFVIGADRLGGHTLTARAKALEHEINLSNNVRNAMIEVVEQGRLRVLFYSEIANFDVGKVRQVLARDSRIHLDLALDMIKENALSRKAKKTCGYVKLPTELNEFNYDVIILGPCAMDKLPDAQVEGLYRFVVERGGGLILLPGRDEYGPARWRNEKIKALMPVLLGAGTTGNYSRDKGQIELTLEGIDSKVTSPENLGDHDQPVAPYYRTIDKKPAATVLATAKNHPIAVVHRVGRGRVCLLNAASLFRWYHEDNNGGLLQEFMSGLTAYVGRITGIGSTIELFAQQVDDRSDKVEFHAYVCDKYFEPVTAANVLLSVADQVLIMNQIGKGYYVSETENIEGKAIIATVQAELNGSFLGEKTIAVNLPPSRNEMDNTELDSRFLQSLGQQIGARYFDIDSMDESVAELFKATRSVGSTTYMTSAWPRWWLLGLSCLLLSICWFVRRAIGLV